MSQFQLTGDQLAETLTKSFQGEFEKLLRQRLATLADSIIESVAKDMARSLRGAVSSYARDHLTGEVRVVLQINDKEIPL